MWTRQWIISQAAREDKSNNNLCCTEQSATANFASCFPLSVQARACNDGKGKTSSILWNWEDGVFLSGSQTSACDLILGTWDLARRLQCLQWLPGKAGLISYSEGKNEPHPKMLIHEPKAIGCWSPTRIIPCRNCWKWNTLDLEKYLLRSHECQKTVGRCVPQASRKLPDMSHRHQVKKNPSDKRSLLQLQYWNMGRLRLLNFPWLS